MAVARMLPRTLLLSVPRSFPRILKSIVSAPQRCCFLSTLAPANTHTVENSNTTLPSDLLPKLETLCARHAVIVQTLSTLSQNLSQKELASLSRELSDLQPVRDAYKEWLQVRADLVGVEEILGGGDAEMAELARDEATVLRTRQRTLERVILDALLPRDEADAGAAILEIRAGTGGSEAALFAADMLEMYERFSARRGWRWEPLTRSEEAVGGGLKDVTINVTGRDVYRMLKYEAGVHRVQRVPATEAQGRIHTSTVTVAIMPQPITGKYSGEANFKESELKIDAFRSSGAGGQHVNTTDSAVRITHLPTGLVVSMQDERSQHKNKAKALKLLAAKLYTAERERLTEERRRSRNIQIGSATRSEKIRTYNYPQNRITDHRTKVSVGELGSVIKDGMLEPLVEACMDMEREELLRNLQV